MLTIYGLSTCDTCRRARKSLDPAEFVDIRRAPVARAQLAAWLAEFGTALVNRKSTTWRGLSEAERRQDDLDLLAAHPTLMKRPVIEAEGVRFLGFGKDVQSALL